MRELNKYVVGDAIRMQIKKHAPNNTEKDIELDTLLKIEKALTSIACSLDNAENPPHSLIKHHKATSYSL